MKTQVEQLKDKYEIGHPIFLSLFGLFSADLLKKLQSILGKQRFDDDWILGAKVEKVITDDSPSRITVSWFDRYEINSYGIFLKPESGQEKQIVEFNEHFKL